MPQPRKLDETTLLALDAAGLTAVAMQRRPPDHAPSAGSPGELNPAARVTAEAAMDLPSPPFSSSDSGHQLLLKRHKQEGRIFGGSSMPLGCRSV